MVAGLESVSYTHLDVYKRQAQRRVDTGFRHADDQVGFYRILPGQQTPCLLMGLVNADAVDDAVRPGKIDVFKYSQRAFTGAVVFNRPQAVFVRHQNFAWLHIPHKFRPNRIQRTGFGSEYIAVVQFSNAQRPDTQQMCIRDRFAAPATEFPQIRQS